MADITKLLRYVGGFNKEVDLNGGTDILKVSSIKVGVHEVTETIAGKLVKIGDITDGASGADQVGATAVRTFTTVQSILEKLDTDLTTAQSAANAAQSNIDSHEALTNNPHSVTKAQVLAGNLIVNADVDNAAAIAESKLALTHSTSSLNSAVVAAQADADQAISDAAAAQATANAALPKSGGTMTGAIAMGNNKITGLMAGTNANDAVTKAQLDAVASGTDFQADVLARQVDNTLDPGASPSLGDRYIILDSANLHANFGTIAGVGDDDIVQYDGSDFIVTFDASTHVGGGVLTWSIADASFYNYDGSLWSPYGGLSGVTAGVGLVKSGNTLNVNLGAGIKELPSDEIGIDVAAAGGLELSDETSSGQLRIKAAGVSDAMLASTFVKTVNSVAPVAGNVSIDSDDVSEGSSNLYFTAARAKSAAVADAINDGTTDVAPSQNAVFDALALKANDNIVVKSVNGQTPTAGAVTINSSHVAENTNLYFTDERAQDAVGAMIADTATIDLTYTDGTPELKADLKAASVQESHLASGIDAETFVLSAGYVAAPGAIIPGNTIQDAISKLDARSSVQIVTVNLMNNTGSTIPANSLVCLSTTVAGEMVLADASALSTCEGIVGVTMADVLNGVSGVVQIAGEITLLNGGVAFDLGKSVYASETAGQGTKTAPNANVIRVGKASATNKVILNIEIVLTV